MPWTTALRDRGEERAIDLIDWNDTMVIGDRQRDQEITTYRVNANLGLEQWEGSRLSAHFRFRWSLRCTARGAERERQGSIDPDCTLEEDRLSKGPDGFGLPVIRSQGYRSGEGSIKFRTVEWDNGVLNFSLMDLNSSPVAPIEVSMRFRYSGDTMHLAEFKAATLSSPMFSDSAIEPIEFRIPDYSYAYYLPFAVKGWKRSVHRPWNELVSTLSSNDRRVWSDLSLQEDKFNAFAFAEFTATNDRDSEERFVESLMAKVFPGRQITKENPLTAEENRRLNDEMHKWLADRFGDWLQRSSMTHQGQARLLAHLRDDRS